MNRSPLLLLFVLSAALAGAEGAGGVEITQALAGPWGNGNPLPGRGIGGFGYGVLDDGTVIGGFGMGVHGTDFDAGYGGTMQGWQHRWGPLVAMATTKLGFGGAVGPEAVGFSMLGAGEVQVGVLLLPWFNVGFKVGVMGTATFGEQAEPLLVWSPVAGLRVSWGSF